MPRKRLDWKPLQKEPPSDKHLDKDTEAPLQLLVPHLLYPLLLMGQKKKDPQVTAFRVCLSLELASKGERLGDTNLHNNEILGCKESRTKLITH